MSRFQNIQFLKSANDVKGFPPDTGREVAFAGRSNSGKSSAINVLTQRRGLARTSKTPGRTQLINFFAYPDERRLVDLPGYGFAKVPARVQRHWHDLMGQYFERRQCLQGLVILMDSRRPLMPFDQHMLEFAGDAGCPVHILLTKADKLSRGAAAASFETTRQQLAPGVGLQLFSALNRQGVDDARAVISQFLDWD
ncbi:MAG: YihA family ribosome biogenesis GTP-binding protein [Gammaproteobacteria bacterium]|nr:YihA family ribosome biogenesis GTP-binding protein [Gammaproteobacteria bacterium]